MIALPHRLGEEFIQEKQRREQAEDIADIKVQKKRGGKRDDVQPRAALPRKLRDAERNERQEDDTVLPEIVEGVRHHVRHEGIGRGRNQAAPGKPAPAAGINAHSQSAKTDAQEVCQADRGIHALPGKQAADQIQGACQIICGHAEHIPAEAHARQVQKIGTSGQHVPQGIQKRQVLVRHIHDPQGARAEGDKAAYRKHGCHHGAGKREGRAQKGGAFWIVFHERPALFRRFWIFSHYSTVPSPSQVSPEIARCCLYFLLPI